MQDEAPENGYSADSGRRAPRHRLTRWAALAAAAQRYYEGAVTADVAARQAAVPLEEFEQFLTEWFPRGNPLG
ncbi:MAG TPA: hypothetical protein VK009_14925 [Chloroflexota bacterium]|nr:hypothetical protein [Chloroflexota bacterium]